MSISMILYHFFKYEYIPEALDGNYRVINNIKMGAIIKTENQNILLNKIHSLNIGDVIKVKSKIYPFKNSERFNAINYFKGYKVSGQVYHLKDFSIIKKANDIRNNLYQYINNGDNMYSKYAPLLLLGISKDSNNDIYSLTRHLSILHLFVISGFHISVIIKGVSYFLSKLKIKSMITDILPITLIWIYLYFLNFPISAMRACLFSTLCFINKSFLKNYFSKINVLAITAAIIFMSNLYIALSLSFCLTFLATFIILFVNSLNLKHKKIWAIASVYLSTLPISIYINHWLNIFGILFGVILSIPTVVVYSLTLILFPLKNSMEVIYVVFDFVLKSFNQLSIIIDINWMNNYIFLIYYIIITLCILYMAKKNI